MQAPDGETLNFDNPPNKNRLAWLVITCCMVLATTFLCLRLYARCWKTKRIQFEESKYSLIIPRDELG